MAGEREVSSAHRTGMAEALARYCSCISVAMDTRVALFRYTETFRISSLYVFYKSGRVEGGRERDSRIQYTVHSLLDYCVGSPYPVD